jgi:predicted metal-dependent phosphoesterase TrpH
VTQDEQHTPSAAPQPRKVLIEVHAHSNYSDGAVSPAWMFRKAKGRGLRGLILTDHDTLEHWQPSFVAARRYGLATTPAVEVSTARGHIIAYFPMDVDKAAVEQALRLDTEAGIILHPVDDAIDKIHELGGVVAIPHPFGPFYPLRDPDYSRVDAIEEYNAWIYGKFAVKHKNAWGYGKQHNIAAFGGSDAHYPFMVGLGATAIPADTDFSQPDWFVRLIREKATEPVECHTTRTEWLNNIFQPMCIPLSFFYNWRYVMARYRRRFRRKKYNFSYATERNLKSAASTVGRHEVPMPPSANGNPLGTPSQDLAGRTKKDSLHRY